MLTFINYNMDTITCTEIVALSDKDRLIDSDRSVVHFWAEDCIRSTVTKEFVRPFPGRNTVVAAQFYGLFPYRERRQLLQQYIFGRIMAADNGVPKKYYKVFQNYYSKLSKARVKSVVQSSHEDTIDKAISSIGKITLSDAAKKIGQITGFFDTPMIPALDEYPQANIDLPLSGRSLGSMTGDVGNLSNFYGDPVDPMDIIARCKIPGRVARFTWGVSDTTGTILNPFRSIGVQPRSIPVTPSISVVDDFGIRVEQNETMLSFFSKYFAYWRGSLKFTVEVVCTKFHQGQIFMAFVPTCPYQGTVYNMATSVVTFAEAKNCYCATLDLSLNNRTEITIPYVSPLDYSRTGFESEDKIRGPWAAANNSAIGALYFFVQNPLDVTSTVASNVGVNVYISAGDDFEFKVIYPASGYLSYTNGVVQSGEVSSAPQVPVEVTNAPTQLDLALNNSSMVPSADTLNIFEREYIIGNFAWTTSQVDGFQLTSVTLPDAYFSNTALAPRGLRNYHYLLHTDFEVRIRLNPTPFHLGMLVMFWSPYEQVDFGRTSFYSVTQFPHVFLNIGNERECALRIPYSAITKLQVSNVPAFGYLYIYVWNPLDTAVGQQLSLNGTIWCKAVNSYIAVKTVFSNVQSGELSDTAKGTTTSSTLGTQDTTTKSYLKSNHARLECLLRRPDYIANYKVSVGANVAGHIHTIAKVGNINGPRHLALLRTCTFWSGNNKLTVVSTVNKTQSYVLGVWPNYGGTQDGYNAPAADHVVNIQPMKGQQFVSLNTTPIQTFELPYYNVTPFSSTMLPTPQQYLSAYNCHVVTIMASVNATDLSPGVYIFFMHSVGDQFQTYLCRNAPKTYWDALPLVINPAPSLFGPRIGPNSAPIQNLEDTLPDLQRSGDVESNPGPVVSRFLGACEQTAKGSVNQLYDLLMAIKDVLMLPVNMARTLGSLDKMIKIGGKTFTNVCDAINSLFSHLGMIVDFVFHCSAITTALIAKSITSLMLAGAHFTKWATSLAAPKELERGASTQSGEDFTSYFASIDEKKVSLGIMCVCTTILAYFGYSVNKFKIYHDVCVATKGAGVLTSLTACVMYFFEGDSALTSMVMANQADVMHSIEAMNGILAKPFEHDFSTKNAIVVEKFQSDYKQLQKFTIVARGSSTQLIKQCEQINVRLQEYSEDDKHVHGKQEPIGTFITGQPGCGKTTLLTLLSVLQCKIANIPNSVYKWPVDKEQKYADGYRNQNVVEMDEALASTSSESILVVVRLMNCEDFPVNQADLKDKGKRFTSRIVNLTSNIRTLDPVSKEVICPEAFSRRMSFKLSIKPSEMYTKNGFMDLEKFTLNMESLLNNDQVNRDKIIALLDDAYSVELFEFGTNTFLDKTYSWAQYFEDFAQLWAKRDSVFESAKRMKQKLRALVQSGEDLPPYFENVIPEDYESNALRILQFYNSQQSSAYPENINDIFKMSKRRYLDAVGPCESPVPYKLGEIISRGQAIANVHYLYTDRVEFPGILSMSNIIQGALGVIIVGATTFALFKLILRLYKMIISGVESLMQGGYDGFKIKKDRPVGMPISTFVQNEDRDAAPHVVRNLRTIYFTSFRKVTGETDGSLHTYRVHALAVNSRNLLIPVHFIQQYKDDIANGHISEHMRITMHQIGDQCNSQPLDVSTFKPLTRYGKNVDIGILYTTTLTHCRDILSSFVKRADYAKFVASNMKVLVTLLGDGKRTESVRMRFKSSSQDSNAASYTFRGKDTIIPVCWIDPLEVVTKAGDCGRPYLLPGNRQFQIFALHSLIDSKGVCSGGSEIDYEMIAPVLQGFHIEHDVDMQLECDNKPNKYWVGDVSNCGRAIVNGFPMCKSHVSKTDLVPLSRMGVSFDELKEQCDMLPAAQKPRNGVHPLYTGAQKYDTIAECFPKYQLMNYCAKYFNRTRLSRFQPGRVLNHIETMNGYSEDNVLVMDHIQRNTSCGYWTLFGWKDGKKEFIDATPVEGKRDFYDWSELANTKNTGIWKVPFVKHLSICEDKIRDGCVPYMPWVAATKDELRPRAKVEMCKTRVFEMPGIEFTYLFRKYFGHFATEFKKNYGVFFHHGIGADKPIVWKKYLKDLRVVGNKGFDVDYKNFDGSIPRCCFDFFIAITDLFYSECTLEDKKARHCLVEAMRDAWIIVGSDLVHTDHGGKSGNPLTDVFNSVANIYIVYSCFIYNQIRTGRDMDLSVLDDEVRFITYGDDILFSVSETCLPYFNRKTFADYAVILGMTVTDASKSNQIIESDDLLDLTFLSSQFVPLGETVLCPLPLRSIYKEMLWQPKGTVEDEVDFKQRVRTTCQFIAEHGCEQLRKYREYLRHKGVPDQYMSLGKDHSGFPIVEFDHFVENKLVVQNALL